MNKTFQSGFMILILLTSITLFLISCGKKGGSLSSDEGDYPIEISIFNVSRHNNPPEENKIYKWIEEEFNVTFKWDIAAGDKDQKIEDLIASSEYPDMLYVDSNQFVNAGALLPLEELIMEYAPTLYQHYEYIWNRMFVSAVGQEEAHIYVLPNWGVIDNRPTETWYSDSAMWIQKAVLAEYGYPEVTTMDEYFDLIQRYASDYPVINDLPAIGYTILTYRWRKSCLVNPPQYLAGYPNNGYGIIDFANNMDYQCTWDMDISMRWFKKLNQMNQLGMIDQNSFDDNYEQYLAKLTSGRVLAMHDQHWQFNSAQESLLSRGMGERTFAPLPIVFDQEIKPRYRHQPEPNLNQGYGISVDCEDPIRIVRFLESQIQQDAQRILQWGFEGEDWQWNEDGLPYRTDEQRANTVKPEWQLLNKGDLWFGNSPKAEGAFDDGFAVNLGNTPLEFSLNYKDKPWDRALFAAYGITNYPDLMDPETPRNPPGYPLSSIIVPNGSEAYNAKIRMEETYMKWLPLIIMAEPEDFEEMWGLYVNALNEAGIEIYEDFMEQAYIKRAKHWGDI